MITIGVQGTQPAILVELHLVKEIILKSKVIQIDRFAQQIKNFMLAPGLRGSGKIVRIRIWILFEKFLRIRIRIRNGSDQFQKIVMGSHKIQIFSKADVAIASKLLYFINYFVT